MSIELSSNKRPRGNGGFALGLLGWVAGMVVPVIHFEEILLFVLVPLLGRDMPTLEMLVLDLLKIPLLAFFGVVTLYLVAQLRQETPSPHTSS